MSETNYLILICDGSIDRKLEAGIHEKKAAAELVLDGRLPGVNLEEPKSPSPPFY